MKPNMMLNQNMAIDFGALRALSSIGFVMAVIAAAIAGTNIAIIPILALASTLTHWLAARISHRPDSPLGAALQSPTGQTARKKIAQLGFFFGLLGYGFIFMLTVFISAIFGSVDLSQRLAGEDFYLVLAPVILASLIAITNRLQVSKPARPGQFQSSSRANTETQAPFTVDGEIIDPPSER
ncbi:MAG: hypothetical protein ACPH4G_00860 [Henriciella sp.]